MTVRAETMASPPFFIYSTGMFPAPVDFPPFIYSTAASISSLMMEYLLSPESWDHCVLLCRHCSHDCVSHRDNRTRAPTSGHLMSPWIASSWRRSTRSSTKWHNRERVTSRENLHVTMCVWPPADGDTTAYA